MREKSNIGEVVAFFYYSGHGMIRANSDKLTWMVHNNSDDEHTPIEKQLMRLSNKSNVTVIAFLDCCRTIEVKQHKGASEEPKRG